MRFAEGWILVFLVLVPVLVAAAWAGRAAARRRLRRFAAPHLIDSLTLGRSRARWIGSILLKAVAIGLAIVALARPQWGRRDEPVVRRGVDVVFALDLSNSMLAEDVVPNRLEQARAAAAVLLGSMRGDRVGLVVFGGRAAVQCPLTLDYGAVRMFLDASEPDFSPGPGSDLARAIEESTRLFQGSERRFKAIVLFTDGEDLGGKGQQAAREAHASGVVVHAIGVGTAGGGPIPLRDDAGVLTGYKKDREGRVVTTRFEPSSLDAITVAGGGLFVPAGPVGEEGRHIAEAIAGMEKKEISSRLATRFEDRFQIPLGAAIVLLCLDALWIGGRMRTRAATVRAAAAACAATVLLLPAAPDAAAEPGEAPGSASTSAPKGRADESASHAPPRAEERKEPAPSARVARKNRDGNRLYGRGQYADALGRYQEAGAEAPGLPSLRYNMGNALFRQGEYDKAVSEYLRALERAKGDLARDARYNMGNAEYEQGRYQEAIDAYSQVLKEKPSDEDARRNLELALRMIKQQQQQQEQQQQQQQQQQQEQREQNRGSSQGEPQKQEPREEPRPDQDGSSQDQQHQEQPRNQEGEASNSQRSETKSAKQGPETMSRKEAERLLASLAEEEKRDLRRRQARLPRDASPEKDW